MRKPVRWRPAANSAAFSSLLVVVLVLGYFALTRVMEQRHPGPSAAVEAEPAPGIEFDRFSTRHERTDEEERLSVSLRLRAASSQPVSGFLFVVARNDHVTPHLWVIWPPQANGLAITSGGHFHAATPTAGEALTLTDRWERISTTLPHPPGQLPFDTVVIYFVSPQGQILLSRPFGL
jgi:hypothetical protein